MASPSINSREIDDFLDRVESVEQELKALMSKDAPLPSVAPRTVTPSAPEPTAVAKTETPPPPPLPAEEGRDPNTARWNAERRAREAAEEKERWWGFARMMFGEPKGSGATSSENKEQTVSSRKSRAPLAPADYKKWDAWSPEDPATKAEALALAERAERARDAEFEKANPGFVKQFHEDSARRQASERAKEADAAKAKERGNAAFKKGDHGAALAAYHDALRLSPFVVASLNNIALVHLAQAKAAANAGTAPVVADPLRPPSPTLQAAANEAIEFTTRALFVDPRNVKALFRRATTRILLGELAAAEADLAAAAALDSTDDEVRRLLATTRLDLAEKEKELRVAAANAPCAQVSEYDSEDTPVAAPTAAWEAPIFRLVELFAPSAAPSAVAAPLIVPQSMFTDVLKHLDDDDARVALRVSGGLAALSRAVVAAAAAWCDAPEAAGSASATPMSAATLRGACTTLAAAADNPKNRALLESDGVLAACLAILATPDALLGGGALQGTGHASGTEADTIREVACAALHVIDVVCRDRGVTALDSRALVARHSFISSPVHDPRVGAPSCCDIAQRLTAASAALRTAPPATITAAGGVLEYIELCSAVLQSLGAGGSAYETRSSSAAAGTKQAGSQPIPIALVPFDALSAWGGREHSDHPHVIGALLETTDALLQRATALGGAEPGAALLSSAAMQRCVGALANLAQLSALRPLFVVSGGDGSAAASRVDGSGVAGGTGRAQPLLKLLAAAAATGSAQGAAMAASEGWLVVLSGAVAALANACLGTPAVVDALCASGAPQALLQLVVLQQQEQVSHEGVTGCLSQCRKDAASAAPAATVGELIARAAALLARVSSHPLAAAALQAPESVRSLTHALAAAAVAAAAAVNPSAGSGASALLEDSLVRVIAGAVNGAAQPAAAAAAAFFDAGGLRAIVAVMRGQLASLSLCPAAGSEPTPAMARFTGLGNACKLLGSLLDSDHVPRDAALAAGCVDVLVDSLKLEGGSSSPHAAAVRKNASVALARAVRDVACMARARELRGIEILVQLQMSK